MHFPSCNHQHKYYLVNTTIPSQLCWFYTAVKTLGGCHTTQLHLLQCCSLAIVEVCPKSEIAFNSFKVLWLIKARKMLWKKSAAVSKLRHRWQGTKILLRLFSKSWGLGLTRWSQVSWRYSRLGPRSGKIWKKTRKYSCLALFLFIKTSVHHQSYFFFFFYNFSEFVIQYELRAIDVCVHCKD